MKKQTNTPLSEAVLALTISELRDFMVNTFATKEDLDRFATKEDLERFATKEDLRNELRAYVTKEDLEDFSEDINAKLNKFATRKDVYDMAENLMSSTDATDKQIQNHEKRITALESAKN